MADRFLVLCVLLLQFLVFGVKGAEWRQYNRPAPDLIAACKDKVRKVNLRNLRGNVVVIFGYNFKGVPEAGVPRDPHC